MCSQLAGNTGTGAVEYVKLRLETLYIQQKQTRSIYSGRHCSFILYVCQCDSTVSVDTAVEGMLLFIYHV